MRKSIMLPIGIESFEEIRKKRFYYIDKTRLIEQLLTQSGKVNLFTRPRRFGKSLNMSMLKSFFEKGADKSLFDGLYISKRNDLCDQYMGKYPVLFISLKNVDGLTFEAAKYQLIELIGLEAERFHFLLESNKLTENEKSRYRALIDLRDGHYTMDNGILLSSLQTLSQLLYKHYDKKAIILIDEYDVPLDKAFQNGYYQEMVSLIRGLFGKALKTNEALEFAVLTGCLRVSKESIFTGLNNFNVLSIIDPQFDEEFGFTQDEVRELLETFHLESHIQEVKEWYDGYRFGNTDVYCPWDVLSHVQRLLSNPNTKPEAYWINSSGNMLVKRFIDKADKTTRDEIEILLNGGVIEKELRLELTYEEIGNSIDNLWSVLFTTGYLTESGEPEDGVYKLRIPNEEIRQVFRTQIKDLFKENIRKEKKTLSPLWSAFENGNAPKVEEILNSIMSRTISVYDPAGPEKEKEKFYHAFLSGILVGNGNWGVHSNKESGDGRPDITVELEDPNKGLVIEVKSCEKVTKLERECEKAMEQIHNLRYDEELRNEGYNDIWAYAIAFYKKRCHVMAEKVN